jgi:hypothetical protein
MQDVMSTLRHYVKQENVMMDSKMSSFTQCPQSQEETNNNRPKRTKKDNGARPKGNTDCTKIWMHVL